MQMDSAMAGRNPASRLVRLRRKGWIRVIGAMAAAGFAAVAVAATPRVDPDELQRLGFKVLVATTKVQQDWVRGLPAGEIRPMQRTGKKYFVYPDAANDRILVGGPGQYEAYRQLHPEGATSPQDAAARASAHRAKQDAAMRKATARDLSDPFLGVTWTDLGW